MTIVLFTDGGARGNPGPAATGVVIFSTDLAPAEAAKQLDSTKWGKPLQTLSTHLGETTNNVAEWSAVVEGVDWIVDNHPGQPIVGFLDSELVQRQIIGRYKVKDLKMKEHKQQFDKLIKAMQYDFYHIERAYNKLADALVNKTLDEFATE
jgi:ribonuclease HI